MTAEEGFDDRYVRYREHAELAREFAELKATQTQNSASLQRIEALLIARPNAPQQPHEMTALAAVLHRALDAADKRASPGGVHPILTTLAAIGLLAIGAAVVFFLRT